MKIALIAALTPQRVIGKNNQLPWHLPNDLKRFHRLTQNKTVIMGRKTYESIGHALPHRQNIIVTRNKNYNAPACEIVSSLEEAIKKSHAEEIMIIGGESLYQQALPLADTLYLTYVETNCCGDTWFPKFSLSDWDKIESESFPADEKHPYAYTFVTLKRHAQHG